MTSGHSNKFYQKVWKHNKDFDWKYDLSDNACFAHNLIRHCAENDCAFISHSYDYYAERLREINARFVARNIEFA